MSKIQALFNRAKLEYNDEDAGIIRISNNPFAKYKIPKQPITRKRSLTDEQIRAIKEYRIPENMLGVIIARDVFLMSFFMVGMNTVDMFYLNPLLIIDLSTSGGRQEPGGMIGLFFSIKSRTGA